MHATVPGRPLDCFCFSGLGDDLLALLTTCLSLAEIAALNVAWGTQVNLSKSMLHKLLARSLLTSKAPKTIARDALDPDEKRSASLVPYNLAPHYARLRSEWGRVTECRREYGRGTALDAANSDFRNMYLHDVKMRRSSPGCHWEEVQVVSVDIDDKPCVLVLAQTQQCICNHDTSYGTSVWNATCCNIWTWV